MAMLNNQRVIQMFQTTNQSWIYGGFGSLDIVYRCSKCLQKATCNYGTHPHVAKKNWEF